MLQVINGMVALLYARHACLKVTQLTEIIRLTYKTTVLKVTQQTEITRLTYKTTDIPTIY